MTILTGSVLLRSESQSISGQGSRADSFNYDAMGNRTSATITSQGGGTFNYGSATTANQYTGITGRSAITHDANGNQLLNGAGAAFTWDSENRLLTVIPVSPNIGDKAHVHSYDGLHRRVTRTTREWTSSGWTNLETTYFIYDGWNVIEEWTSTFSPATTATLTRRLTWGQDLAGSPSLQGAGGVGGLLMVEEITSTTNEAYHFHYDGNGNVTEVTDHLGVSVATYRYDAFGNTLVATGSYALTNRYRFSTKPLDHEVTTAPLYYYGYRYYDPVTGRWPSRDPIEERGGVNLYGFVGNDGVNQWDYLGLAGKRGPTIELDTQDIVSKKDGAGTCGGAQWVITWVLSGADQGQKGVIAQQVTWDGWYQICGKKAKQIRDGFREDVADKMLEKQHPFELPNLTEYWETNGNTVSRNKDTWFQSRYGGLCTKGTITITATAAYFPGQGVPGNAKPGGHPYSGTLPSIVGHAWPGGGNVLIAHKTRKMTISWDCCDNKMNPTKVR